METIEKKKDNTNQFFILISIIIILLPFFYINSVQFCIIYNPDKPSVYVCWLFVRFSVCAAAPGDQKSADCVTVAVRVRNIILYACVCVDAVRLILFVGFCYIFLRPVNFTTFLFFL